MLSKWKRIIEKSQDLWLTTTINDSYDRYTKFSRGTNCYYFTKLCTIIVYYYHCEMLTICNHGKTKESILITLQWMYVDACVCMCVLCACVCVCVIRIMIVDCSQKLYYCLFRVHFIKYLIKKFRYVSVLIIFF